LIFAAWLVPWAVTALLIRNVLWLVLVLVVELVLAGWILSRRRALMSGAVAASPETQPRLMSLVRGLSGDLGMQPPAVYVSPASGANAFVVPGAVVVTEELLAEYARTELEAVVAHCLVRLHDGGLGWAVAATAVRNGSRFATPFVGPHLDARAAALTRYPPALASALEKTTPVSGAAASMWFVADAPSHAPVDSRVAELRDL
ncbi:MAG TPA: hypothetical protein VIG64_04970, partial [Actinomycetota bacterium]